MNSRSGSLQYPLEVQATLTNGLPVAASSGSSSTFHSGASQTSILWRASQVALVGSVSAPLRSRLAAKRSLGAVGSPRSCHRSSDLLEIARQKGTGERGI